MAHKNTDTFISVEPIQEPDSRRSWLGLAYVYAMFLVLFAVLLILQVS